jgi:hypothetical protein
MTRLRRMLKTLQLLTLQLRVTPSVHSLTEGPFRSHVCPAWRTHHGFQNRDLFGDIAGEELNSNTWGSKIKSIKGRGKALKNQ